MVRGNKAQKMIRSLHEIAYLGGYNAYSTQPYSQDAAAYMEPFQVVQLPDYAGDDPDEATTYQQTGDFDDWQRRHKSDTPYQDDDIVK